MVETGDGQGIEVKEEFEDRATRSFRTLVQEKKDLSGQKRVMTFLYTASTFLVMVVLVIGITLINNYEKMEGLEMALTEISQSLESQDGQAALSSANGETDEEQQMTEAMEQENARALEEELAEAGESETPDTEKQEEEDVESETPTTQEEEPEAQEPESTEEALSQNVVSIPESYTVEKGDTLLKISRKIY